VITDDAVLASPDFGDAARAALAAGGKRLVLHLRGPATSGATLFALASALVPVARRSGARLVVNDRIDVALAAGADGVQLGRRSLTVSDARAAWPEAWIGTSVHSAPEAVEAGRAGTDFLVLGTIYATPSHPGMPGAGVGGIGEAVTQVRVPVVAIGGIDANRIGEVAGAGAAGVAVLSAVWGADDAAHAVATLLRAWDRRGGKEAG
jgi:thiamine-phosphate pyrophosphorylase